MGCINQQNIWNINTFFLLIPFSFLPFFYCSVVRYSNLNVQPYSISGRSFKQCPEIIYANLANKRDIIPSENNGKTGVYVRVNIIYNIIYIASGGFMYVRLSDYFQKKYLISRSNLYIVFIKKT